MADTRKLDCKARKQAKRTLRKAYTKIEASLTRKQRTEWHKSEKSLKIYLADAAKPAE
jgi:hypothetical protein